MITGYRDEDDSAEVHSHACRVELRLWRKHGKTVDAKL